MALERHTSEDEGAQPYKKDKQLQEGCWTGLSLADLNLQEVGGEGMEMGVPGDTAGDFNIKSTL